MQRLAELRPVRVAPALHLGEAGEDGGTALLGIALDRLALRREQDDITEEEVREALLQLDPLWDELFPAEQARMVQLLVERIDVGVDGVSLRLRVDGFSGLTREMAGSTAGRRAA